jgi:hypothetical protein
VLFATTAFVSAMLLFWVQPMIAKMVLPSLGGTPAVWNTCLVFFQAVLLAGYAYAHLSVRWLGVRKQAWLHAAVVLLPWAVLPLSLGDSAPPAGGNPAGWLLLALARSVGLPFFVLAATAPLLQRWFAEGGGPAGQNPYPLYAASNVGSILALLSYPALVEPHLSLGGSAGQLSQTTVWAAGYGLFCLLVFACHAALIRGRAQVPAARPAAGPPPTPVTRLRWVGLAFVPSSLMLGITTYITVDIVAVPLLWVIPLVLYLLSFVIVFARWPAWCHKGVIVAMPFLALPAIFIAESGVDTGIVAGVALHLLALFVVALMCHGELAKTKPAPGRLTEFYLLLSVGGVLGGLFNGLLAPLIFPSVVEQEIAVVLACLLLPALRPAGPLDVERRFGWRPSRARGWCADVLAAVLIGVVTLDLLIFSAGRAAAADAPADPTAATHDEWKFLLYGAPLLGCVVFRNRPLRFGLAVAAVIGAAWVHGPLPQPGRAASVVVHRERSFFGALTVEVEAPGTVAESHVLTHGTTLHGQQFTHPQLKHEPLTYYTRSGPVGQVMRVVAESKAPVTLAMIGLGSGASACYGRSGDALVCYEIDGAVARIAADPDYFTYLTDCEARGCPVRIVLGDARLRLREAPDRAYDVMIVDAFSSDAVPIHLLTRQAFELYADKLAPDGYLLVHISNRFLNLEPVIGNVARALSLPAYCQFDDVIDLPGKRASDWIVIAKDPGCVHRLLAAPPAPQGARQRSPFAETWPATGNIASVEKVPDRSVSWKPVATDDKVGVWTDDYSNLFGVFRPR